MLVYNNNVCYAHSEKGKCDNFFFKPPFGWHFKVSTFFLKSIDNLFIELYNDNTSLFVCMIIHGHSPIWKRDYMCLG